MRIHTEQITATDLDALAGTLLDTMESPGQLDIFVLSSQADSLYSITGPGNEPLVQSAEIMQETRAPRPNDDLPLTLAVNQTGHFTISLTIVTAATIFLQAIYRKQGVDY